MNPFPDLADPLDHRRVIERLAQMLHAAGCRISARSSTDTHKRPDLISLGPGDMLTVWEIKTRYTALERRQAWTKYSAHCDRLIMAYAPTVIVPDWYQTAPGQPPDPSLAAGAFIVRAGNPQLIIEPQQLTPRPAAKAHLLAYLPPASG